MAEKKEITRCTHWILVFKVRGEWREVHLKSSPSKWIKNFWKRFCFEGVFYHKKGDRRFYEMDSENERLYKVVSVWEGKQFLEVLVFDGHTKESLPFVQTLDKLRSSEEDGIFMYQYQVVDGRPDNPVWAPF